MRPWLARLFYGSCALVLLLAALMLGVAYLQAQGFVHPHRIPLYMSPSDYGIEDFRSLTLRCDDDVRLSGWYIPSRNRAAVILLHGYPGSRQQNLRRAEWLAGRGYGVLLLDQRGQGMSEGDVFTFGKHEVRDVEAAHRYLAGQPDVDAGRIGSWGVSMGGVLALLHAARNQEIKAVLSESAFWSLEATIAGAVELSTGLPAFPFAALIRWFAERSGGFSASDVVPAAVIRSISPRPVLILQGGRDGVVPPDSGRRLYEAAGDPRELWFEPDLGHTHFIDARPKEYERRAVAFFDRYLLGQSPMAAPSAARRGSGRGEDPLN